MPFQTSVVNNNLVPVGAGVVKSTAKRDGQGYVTVERTYYFRGEVHAVSHPVATFIQPTQQGVAIPVFKIKQAQQARRK
jgi:hypothetical protein